MDTPEILREFVEEFHRVQSEPITEVALVVRMRTEATTWINAVHMQHHRVAFPLVKPDAPGDEVFRQEVDLHFLLVALIRLRRSVELVTERLGSESRPLEFLDIFDKDVPSLQKFRNVAEHFDDYTIDKGRRKDVHRDQLQTWSFGEEDNGGLIWRRLDENFSVEDAYSAARNLYGSFLNFANEYLAVPH